MSDTVTTAVDNLVEAASKVQDQLVFNNMANTDLPQAELFPVFVTVPLSTTDVKVEGNSVFIANNAIAVGTISPENSKIWRMNRAVKTIWVTFQKEGIHCYPAAATDPKLESVSFLASPHRHIFHFRVQILVTHNDRDIEFIMFKRELESLYNAGAMLIDHKSCEMLADDLAKYILDIYPNRALSISVSEDNENGCTITY